VEARELHGPRPAGAEIDLKTGKVLESSLIKEIKINPPIDLTFFEKL